MLLILWLFSKLGVENDHTDEGGVCKRYFGSGFL